MTGRTGAARSSAPRAPALRLPKPRLEGGKTLGEALRARRTDREMGARPIAIQALSDLLFAACGVNRARGPFGAPGITAASASNSQEVEVYVLLERGAYRFDARAHALEPVSRADLRLHALGPRQPRPGLVAPVELVFVADVDRLEHTEGFDEPGLHDPGVQRSYYYVDTGLIAGNVYLFAASRGLACWFHNCDRATLARELGLRATERVLFAQSVGHRARGAARSRA